MRRLHINIPEELALELDRLAKADDRSISYLVTKVTAAWVEEQLLETARAREGLERSVAERGLRHPSSAELRPVR